MNDQGVLVMTVPPHRDALVSRLQQELTTFALVREVSSQDAAKARVLHNWTFVHKPNVHVEVCGTAGQHVGHCDDFVITGRVVQVDIDEKVVVTTTGLYRLEQRPASDRAARDRFSIKAELYKVKEMLDEYREDLKTVRRYLSEMMSEDSIPGEGESLRALKHALH